MSLVKLAPICFTFRSAQAGLVMIGMIWQIPVRGDDASVLPQQVTDESFAALKTLSPFRRSIGLKDSIILTGLARIDDDVVATLFDTETSESYLVSQTANPQGWQLVGVRGDESDLESLTAKIQVTGGELVSIRYEKLPQKSRKSSSSRPPVGSSSTRLSPSQLTEAKQAAINYKGEHPADGYPKLPPPEVVKKLSRMSVQQREAINRDMLQLRNRGVGGQDRIRIYNEKIDRAISGGR